MSRVDRRPTVARNFIAGDRRSIEWALEHWQSARPPVSGVTLQGHPIFVTATAQGLHDLGVLHGLQGAPFDVTCELGPLKGSAASPVEALGLATGAGSIRAADFRDGDVVVAVEPEDANHVDAQRETVVIHPAARAVPASIRPLLRAANVRVLPVRADALSLMPAWEGMVEDLAPRRLCVLGRGPRLFGALVAAGDYFLERLREVPGPSAARKLVRERVLLVEDRCVVPPEWKNAGDVHRAIIQRSGAQLRDVRGGGDDGVVLLPEQRSTRAA